MDRLPTGRSPHAFGSSFMAGYKLGDFLRTLAKPESIMDWSLTSLKEKLIKIGAKVVSHGRYVAFQMAEVAIPRQMFQEILRLIAELGRSRHLRQHEALDGHAFRSNRREECVQMPRKMARSGCQTPFGLAEALMAVHTLYLSCGKGRKSANTRSSFGESRLRLLAAYNRPLSMAAPGC